MLPENMLNRIIELMFLGAKSPVSRVQDIEDFVSIKNYLVKKHNDVKAAATPVVTPIEEKTNG